MVANTAKLYKTGHLIRFKYQDMVINDYKCSIFELYDTPLLLSKTIQ